MKYKYELIRSGRKSISVLISDDNKITVRCPWRMHIEDVERYLRSKQGWIDKVVLDNSRRLAINDDVIEGRVVYVEGKRLPLIVGDERGIYSDKVCVKDRNEIEELFTGHYSEEFIRRVGKWAEITKLLPRGVFIKYYKGRWGCCNAENQLFFNYILFMLPKKMQDYVIVHELCHTLCRNHSPAFWKLVSDYVPDYREIRKEMKGFGFLVNLY